MLGTYHHRWKLWNRNMDISFHKTGICWQLGEICQKKSQASYMPTCQTSFFRDVCSLYLYVLDGEWECLDGGVGRIVLPLFEGVVDDDSYQGEADHDDNGPESLFGLVPKADSVSVWQVGLKRMWGGYQSPGKYPKPWMVVFSQYFVDTSFATARRIFALKTASLIAGAWFMTSPLQWRGNMFSWFVDTQIAGWELKQILSLLCSSLHSRVQNRLVKKSSKEDIVGKH